MKIKITATAAAKKAAKPAAKTKMKIKVRAKPVEHFFHENDKPLSADERRKAVAEVDAEIKKLDAEHAKVMKSDDPEWYKHKGTVEDPEAWRPHRNKHYELMDQAEKIKSQIQTLTSKRKQLFNRDKSDPIYNTEASATKLRNALVKAFGVKPVAKFAEYSNPYESYHSLRGKINAAGKKKLMKHLADHDWTAGRAGYWSKGDLSIAIDGDYLRIGGTKKAKHNPRPMYD